MEQSRPRDSGESDFPQILIGWVRSLSIRLPFDDQRAPGTGIGTGGNATRICTTQTFEPAKKWLSLTDKTCPSRRSTSRARKILLFLVVRAGRWGMGLNPGRTSTNGRVYDL